MMQDYKKTLLTKNNALWQAVIAEIKCFVKRQTQTDVFFSLRVKTHGISSEGLLLISAVVFTSFSCGELNICLVFMLYLISMTSWFWRWVQKGKSTISQICTYVWFPQK